jgi:hypothetical protein
MASARFLSQVPPHATTAYILQRAALLHCLKHAHEEARAPDWSNVLQLLFCSVDLDSCRFDSHMCASSGLVMRNHVKRLLLNTVIRPRSCSSAARSTLPLFDPAACRRSTLPLLLLNTLNGSGHGATRAPCVRPCRRSTLRSLVRVCQDREAAEETKEGQKRQEGQGGL